MNSASRATRSRRSFFSVNLRSRAIELALAHVSAAYDHEPINVVEVGCMYNEEQGLSTYVIAAFLAKRATGGKFVSIDWDSGHIEACRAIVRRRDPALEDRIDFRNGHSLRLLPDVLAGLGSVHLVFLDGGEHPEVCLEEFEQCTRRLAEEGIILVDDAQNIPPSDEYPLPRPFGKCTLILPMLVLANYQEHRAAHRASASDPADTRTVPDAAFANSLANLPPLDGHPRAFCVMGTWHRMLACGPPSFVSKAERLTDVGLLRRTAGQLLHRFGLGI